MSLIRQVGQYEEEGLDAHFFPQFGTEFQPNLKLTEYKHDCLIPADQGK